MRAYLALLAVPALAGCISTGGRTGPGSIPDDAYGAMYTDLPVQQVAACFADAIGGTLRPNGSRISVISPIGQETIYDVGTNAAGDIYPTEVIVRGKQNSNEEQRATACFARLSPAQISARMDMVITHGAAGGSDSIEV